MSSIETSRLYSCLHSQSVSLTFDSIKDYLEILTSVQIRNLLNKYLNWKQKVYKLGIFFFLSICTYRLGADNLKKLLNYDYNFSITILPHQMYFIIIFEH